MFLAGAYLLAFIYAMVEYCTSPPKPMSGFGVLIITAPWSFFLKVLLDGLGIMTEENGDSLIFVLIVFGALTNALIICFFGSLLSNIINYLSKDGDG